MKKSLIAVLGLVVLLALGAIWLLGGANPDNLDRQEVVIEMPDTFEK